jgi:hypothetical protein
MTQVEFLQADLFCGDTLNLKGLVAITLLFVIEELGAFGGIIDDLGYLGWSAVSLGVLKFDDFPPTFCWFTASCPALVKDGPNS